MKNLVLLFFVFVSFQSFGSAQSIAQKRANQMGRGVNLTFLDNYWKGTKEKHFADFFDESDFKKRESMLKSIAKEGFQTVRVPISFSAWASMKAPYRWEFERGLEVSDSIINWALKQKLNVIIDLHHTELDGSIPEASKIERIEWIWREVANRYKNTDPDRVLFELRNEPHDIKADVWRAQAKRLIKTVRSITPNHTLIVGFQDWNSRKALIASKPFTDENIIYTFHYYDPFLFTHQGATWSAEGLAESKNIPFPLPKKAKLRKPRNVKAEWVSRLYDNYAKDSKSAKIFSDLKAAKDWSLRNGVPIFLGEFGSFGKNAGIDDRCRHAKLVYRALGKFDIPNAWWEWDSGFSMFEKGTNRIASCMKDAIDSFDNQRLSGWSLAWSDEFNGAKNTGVDKSKWTAEIGGKGWGNREFQYYTDSARNAHQDGEGSLAIKAIKEDLPESFSCWYGKCKYTSARLVTMDKFEKKHGRFEARIKVPHGKGMWAAFWLLGDNFDKVGWAQCGEIDIMENIGREPTKTYGTIHGPKYEGGKGIGTFFDHKTKGDFSDDYHVYAIEWEPNEIRWYVDGEHYQTRTPTDLPKGAEWVYEHPFFILLNLAVGGNWAQSPDDSTKFPGSMLVDYVRVYSKKTSN